MIKIKRLKNLNIIKEKSLNLQKKEVITLELEFEKTKALTQRLKNILANVEKKNITSAIQLYEINTFNIRIIDQINVAENRQKFLSTELIRAKNNLGKLIHQKKIVKDKIDYLTRIKLEENEKKILDNTPIIKKN